ncbi:hypothetical protein BRC90_11985 [Halobacteriales archaeon QS_4_69_34]|nr:MAG: hypothetical protein BRC90_11985 [Halobacteriales archaeon QS_4_69_34]
MRRIEQLGTALLAVAMVVVAAVLIVGAGGALAQGEPTVTDRNFTVLEQGGNATDNATVTFDDTGGRVVVTGTIVGSEACTNATLGSATFDGQSDTLDVVVDINRTEPGDVACGETLNPIDYRAVVTFDGGLPTTVDVAHRDQDGDTQFTATETRQNRSPSSPTMTTTEGPTPETVTGRTVTPPDDSTPVEQPPTTTAVTTTTEATDATAGDDETVKGDDTDTPSDGAAGKAKQDGENGAADGGEGADRSDRGDGKAEQPADGGGGADGGNGKVKLS